MPEPPPKYSIHSHTLAITHNLVGWEKRPKCIYRPKYAHITSSYAIHCIYWQVPCNRHAQHTLTYRDRLHPARCTYDSSKIRTFANHFIDCRVVACCPEVSLWDTFVKRMFYPNEQYRYALCVCLCSLVRPFESQNILICSTNKRTHSASALGYFNSYCYVHCICPVTFAAWKHLLDNRLRLFSSHHSNHIGWSFKIWSKVQQIFNRKFDLCWGCDLHIL